MSAPKPEKFPIRVAVVTVPGGELRVGFDFGEYTFALKVEEAMGLLQQAQDCCQKIIDASVTRTPKAQLQ